MKVPVEVKVIRDLERLKRDIEAEPDLVKRAKKMRAWREICESWGIEQIEEES